ncbi:MAG: hypothetical protein HKN26_01670, partial [Acidimicrobiales bacterium]|nr:hypothetical protein [Acidimicrobiales bacterium]
MHLGINLLWLVPNVVGGSEEYAVRTLLAFLDREVPDIDVTVFALESFVEAHPEIAERVEVVTAALGGGRRRPVRLAAESTWLAREVRRRSIDLMHHVGGRMPAVRSGRTVLTVHDLQ